MVRKFALPLSGYQSTEKKCSDVLDGPTTMQVHKDIIMKEWPSVLDTGKSTGQEEKAAIGSLALLAP